MSDVATLEVSFRFPFGRYGATPWYSSRREELGNVEWPPSPWRLARALVAVAAEHGGDEDWSRSLLLACRLAASAPTYSLPETGELHYTQWMPQLEFGDSLTSAERLDNGHALLDLDPDAWLTARWEVADLDVDDLGLLDALLARLPYLGQSVSVCEARRGPAPVEREERGWARPADRSTEAAADTRTVRLLVAEQGIEGDQLRADTADASLKLQPAPPGTRWVSYVVSERPPRAKRTGQRQDLSALVYRLDGVLRPPVPRLDDLSAGDAAATIHAAVEIALGAATKSAAIAAAGTITLLDDDLDGRAERLRLDVAQPLERWRAKSLLEPAEPLVVGPAQLSRAAHRQRTEPPRVSIDCTLRLDAVEWAPTSERTASQGREALVTAPVCFDLRSERLPPLADAITVAEVFRRRLLGVAAAEWGPHAIPARLSGRDRSGSRLLADHHHAHFLVGSTNDREITQLMIWAPGGFTDQEREAIAAVRLPALAGAGIRLHLVGDHPWLGSAWRWQTVLPFLPVRHPKRRGGRTVDTVEDQVALELRRRDLPDPVSIRPFDRDWRLVRTTRRGRAGSSPGLGTHGVEIEFDQPVEGPIALGANSHFSMGVFAPLDPS